MLGAVAVMPVQIQLAIFFCVLEEKYPDSWTQSVNSDKPILKTSAEYETFPCLCAEAFKQYTPEAPLE